MTVAVLMPVGGAPCPHRDRAREWVQRHYAEAHPDWPLYVGESHEPWSKGAAVADAYQRTTADVLVLADADSYVEPGVVAEAVKRCTAGVGWIMPHRRVYRLREDETERLYAGHRARYTHVVRQPYMGTAGGGVVVLTRTAYETVAGIDPRFYGWGGEDLSFGYALATLVGWQERLTGHLVHLWHPHPAPDLRGSPASEALVARYRAARGEHAVMTALVEEHRGPHALDDPDRDDQSHVGDGCR